MRVMFGLLVVAMVGCGVEGEAFGPDDLDAMLRTAEREPARATRAIALSAEAAAAEDGESRTVGAWICISGVCVWGEGELSADGGTLTVEVPLDPALAGLRITAFVPETGQTFSGTIVY